jgi:hypothetical protein
LKDDTVDKTINQTNIWEQMTDRMMQQFARASDLQIRQIHAALQSAIRVRPLSPVELVMFLACKTAQEPLLPVLKQHYGETAIDTYLAIAIRFREQGEAVKKWAGKSNRFFEIAASLSPINVQAALEMAEVPDKVRNSMTENLWNRRQARP